MGQYEVLEWLIKASDEDKEKFFTSEEIFLGLRNDGKEYNHRGVKRCLFPLFSLGYVESELVRTNGFGTTRRYKASKKALSERSKW